MQEPTPVRAELVLNPAVRQKSVLHAGVCQPAACLQAPSPDSFLSSDTVRPSTILCFLFISPTNELAGHLWAEQMLLDFSVGKGVCVEEIISQVT